MSPSINGLLPGCELVRLGAAGPDEFEQVGDSVLKGARGMSQIIVKPAAGYEFRYRIVGNDYIPVKLLPVKRAFTVCFECAADEDVNTVAVIGAMGIAISVTETTPPPEASTLENAKPST